MTVAILGYGRFGSALAELLMAAHLPVRVYDTGVAVPEPLRARSAVEAVTGASHVILAVPVSVMTQALGSIAHVLVAGQLVMDVGSVKVRPCQALDAALGGRIAWCGSHPLFGPVSLARAERPLRVIICPSERHPYGAAAASQFYQYLGCEVTEQTPDQHDRLMARTHALAFFVAKGLLAVGGGGNEPFAPPSYKAVSTLIELVRSDAGHLFRAIQQENPFSEEMRQSLLNALNEIQADLDMDEDAEEDSSPGGGATSRSFMFAIPDLNQRLPRLRETREQIDGIDREIVDLLARRADLATRAAEEKESIGHGILDPAREAQVLEARREWATEHNLDANAVEEIFRAVMRFSRAAQANAQAKT